MLGRGTKAGANHGSNHNGCDRFAAEHVTKLRCLIEYLVEADAHKVDKHEFCNRPQTAGSGADRRSNESRFRDWRVHDAIAIFSVEALGNTKHTTPGIHLALTPRSANVVFTHCDDRFVTPHLLSYRLV